MEFHQPCIHFLVVKYDYLRSLTNIHVHRRPFEPWIPGQPVRGQAQETRSWRNVGHFYRAHNKQKSWLSGLLNREMNACCFKLRKYTHSLCISTNFVNQSGVELRGGYYETHCDEIMAGAYDISLRPKMQRFTNNNNMLGSPGSDVTRQWKFQCKASFNWIFS